jgi:hypothetical protein
MMALQRELAAWPHHDAFDLIAVAAIEALIPTPGAIDAVMLERELAAIPLQIIDHPLDRLGMLLGEATSTASSMATTTRFSTPTRATQAWSL